MSEPKKGDIIGDGWEFVRHSRRGLYMAVCPKCDELATAHLRFFEENPGCLQCTPKNLGKRVQQIESQVIYSTARTAAQMNGFSEMSMHHAIDEGRAAPDGCHYVYVESDRTIDTPKTQSVKRVEKVETGEVWGSADEAAIASGLNPNLIRRLARSGKPRDGVHWVYTTKESNML